MTESTCPVCGCKKFYVKHPDDEYAIYAFECRDGAPCFDDDEDLEDCPEVDDGTETFCSTCAWHDKFKEIK